MNVMNGTTMNGMTTINGSIRRNPWLERLAHALPYLLFAAVLLLLDSLARAAPTQEEFFKSVQDSVNSTSGGRPGGISLTNFSMFLGAVGIVIALGWLNHRLKRHAASRRRTTPTLKAATNNQPRKLIKEIAKAAGLSSDEVRQLKSLAEQYGYASPLTLLACPSLLIDAARQGDTKADKQVLANVARKLLA
jgi:hypothetical protein